ncbi:MAG: STAS domain-containing protein [Bacteroidota bacterium]
MFTDLAAPPAVAQSSAASRPPLVTRPLPAVSNFSVTFRPTGSVRVLELNGELDAHTASELEAAFQRCLDEEAHHLIVHGGALDYISSAGLGVFMAYVEPMRDAGGDIKITELQERVYDVFDLLGFPMLFDITPSEAEAVAQFETSPNGTSG